MAPGASSFYFAAVEGGYTIHDLSGRYYYQKGTYDNFNVSAELPESGHIWTLIANEDGTVKILNSEVKKFIQFDANYNSWGSYATAKGVMPALVSTVAPVIADGKYYIEVPAGVATPIDASKTYGYVNVAEKSAANAFTFTFTDGEDTQSATQMEDITIRRELTTASILMQIHLRDSIGASFHRRTVQ